jgi:DNA end-binding protein Ku
MAARAIWKGAIKIGATTIPIKLYAAIQSRDVRFHVLQGRTKTRVKQHMVRPEAEQQVQPQEIRKGYEVQPGTFVILDKKELEALKPHESRNVVLTRFVPPDELSNEWYEHPYYVGPDEEEGKYFALVEALRRKHVIGVVRWSMRGKGYVGALRTEGDYLVLIKLRYANEILSTNELPAPSGWQLDAKELRMAEELVSALEGPFDPREFHDDYRDRLMKFIQAKAKGKHPRLQPVKTRDTSASLDSQLAKSLAALKRTRSSKVA